MLCAACAGASPARERRAEPGRPADAAPEVVEPSPRAEAEAPATAPELVEALQRYYDAFAAGDWLVFAAQFWPGGTIVSQRRTALGAEAVVATPIEDYVARAPRRPQPLAIEIESTSVELTGASAQALVRYRASDRSGDAPQRWRGTDAFTFVRHGELWRIASVTVAQAAAGE